MRAWQRLSGVLCVLFLVASCGGGDPESAAQSPRPQARAASTANVVDANAVFDFATSHYPQFFNGASVDGTFATWNYRYFASTGNYVGVDLQNGWIGVLGPISNGAILLVGTPSGFSCQIFPSNCLVTAPPRNNAVALAGLYLGTAGGPSPTSILMVGPDGQFFGYNLAGSRMDFFSGTAFAQSATTWSAIGSLYDAAVFPGPVITPGLATFAGSNVAGNSLSANVSVTGFAPVSSQLAMTENWQSATPSSLAIIGGVYSAPSVGQAVTVDPTSGSITGNLSSTCAITGAVTVPEPTRNIYKIIATLSGAGCPANGPVSLLGFYYTATNGQQEVLMFGVSAGGQNFVTLTMARHG